MAHILIIESNTSDLIEKLRARDGMGAGENFAEKLKRLAEIQTTIVEPYNEAFDPAILFDVDAVVLTGSGVAWSVDDQRAAPLQNAAHAVFNAGKPIWGSCNGLQMAAFILGGENGASPNGFELGLARNLQIAEAGLTHPMMKGRKSGYAVPCVHRDEVTRLPDGASLMASNAHSSVQAFVYEQNGVTFWGTQYHPEFTAEMVGGLMESSHGIFSDVNGEAQDLLLAERDEAAAQRLGIHSDEMKDEFRMCELKNWLDYVQAARPSLDVFG